MTVQDILKFALGLIGSKTITGGIRDSEVYVPPADPLISAQGRFNFFRDAYRSLLYTSLFLSITIIALIGTNCWIVFSAAPQDRFFVASVDGRVIMVLPLDLPNAPNNDIFSRTGTALTDSLTFGYLDPDFRRSELAPIFSAGVIENIQQSLVLNTDTLQQLSAQLKSFVTTYDNRRPGGIIAQGVNPLTHIYEWTIQLPVIVTIKMGVENTPTTSQPFTLQVLVQRSRMVESRYGYTISKLVAFQADGPAVPVAAASAAQQPAAQGTPTQGGATP